LIDRFGFYERGKFMRRRTLLQTGFLLGATLSARQNHAAAPGITQASRINAVLAAMRTRFPEVIDAPERFRLQIEYSYPDKNGWHHESYRRNAEWTAPASTVKLPIAMLALHRLAQLKQPRSTQLKVLAPPECAAQAAELAEFEPIARTLERMLIVSDNGAFNRLYEFVGGDRIPSLLRRFGFPNAKLQARLGACTPEDNRRGRGVVLADTAGAVIWQDASTPEIQVIAPLASGGSTKVGNAYLDFNETLIQEPKDFQYSNHWTIRDAHALTLAIAGVSAHPLWDALGLDDQQFLRGVLSTLPRNAGFSEAEYPDAWGKFLAFGDQKGRMPATLACANKIGEAYGFLLDSAWLMRLEKPRLGQAKMTPAMANSCVLSAVIYVNRDGVLNDDKYDYETIGVPFLAELGRRILALV
jgi:hypothetical protein